MKHCLGSAFLLGSIINVGETKSQKKKPTKLKYCEILITALMDLIIGTLLLIIGKIIE